MFAIECYSQFCKGYSEFTITEHNKELYQSCRNVYGSDLEIVNTFLEQYYGLKAEADTRYNPSFYNVSIKK